MIVIAAMIRTCHGKRLSTVSSTWNSNEQRQPLSCDKLMAIAVILSENVVTTQRKLEHVSTSDEILQIIKLMPIMLLTEKDHVYINLHEFLFTSGVLEAFTFPFRQNLLMKNLSS